MSRSKDQERFPRLKAQNGRYRGFSGSNVHVEKPADELADFGSLGCQELQAVAVSM
jgi:hypothetical protein